MQELNLKAALTLLKRGGIAVTAELGTDAHLQQVIDGLVALSAIDPLTGLPNRRRLEEEFVRRERKISLMAVDIDNFKRVNDIHGHAAGDKVLRITAQVIRAAVRDSDIPARVGGEEFAVLLPNADINIARDVAERLRRTFAQTFFGEGVGQLTISIGVATMRRGESPEECLVRADTCLYAAKRDGRNRVVVDSGESIADEPVEA